MDNADPAPGVWHACRMKAKRPLPAELGWAFSVPAARELGVGRSRLRGDDLQRPFRGVRTLELPPERGEDRYQTAKRREFARIDALAQRLVPGQFFSHRSAARIWGMPVPHQREPELHLAVRSPSRAPRIRGVHGHRMEPKRAEPELRNGYPVTSAAATWASLANLDLSELVAAGDYLLRRYRRGHGRPHAGRPPLATLDDFRAIVALGRWPNMTRLQQALALVREDAWSPRESLVRLVLVRAGLPEPELNIDVFDSAGVFLACLDMAYPRYRVAVEYHGGHHSDTYAEDIERVERLRAERWIVIQVTKALASDQRALAHRVAGALRERGWGGRP